MKRLTICLFLCFLVVPDSRESTKDSGEEYCEVGLNKCSNMAIMRNIEIKMAVATKPKEMAFIDVSKLLHGASLSTKPACGEPGSEVVYMLQGFDLSELKSLIVTFLWNYLILSLKI